MSLKVEARKIQWNCSETVTRVYVPQFFVSSQQRFGATDIKALGASQLSGLGQTVLQLLGKSVLQLHFIYKIAGESKTQREESGGVHGFGSSFYMFFSSTWACPMQIGLSQECCLFCLFCLKSSLWSLDLPCRLATAILDSFSLFYLPNNTM